MKNDQVRKITGVAILLAIEIVLQAIGNYITPSAVSINLSLIPVALGAILFGPLSGAFLGLMNHFSYLLIIIILVFNLTDEFL